MYQGLTVVENFTDWEFLYKEKKLPVASLPPGEYYENQGVVLKCPDPKTKELGIIKGGFVVPVKGFYPLKIKPSNTEQALALELLRDDSIPLVTLFGAAGSGKTFLASAYMLHALAKGLVDKIIIAKSLTPVGREIGYLPGGLEDKVNVWLGAFYDNFTKLGRGNYEIEKDISLGKIEISPITFIQGRSISNAILCVDEIQNTNPEIIKQIVTRAGNNCKVLLLGDPSQRFEKGNFDLAAFAEKGKSSSLVSHINFRKSVRSPLASWAVQNL